MNKKLLIFGIFIITTAIVSFLLFGNFSRKTNQQNLQDTIQKDVNQALDITNATERLVDINSIRLQSGQGIQNTPRTNDANLSSNFEPAIVPDFIINTISISNFLVETFPDNSKVYSIPQNIFYEKLNTYLPDKNNLNYCLQNCIIIQVADNYILAPINMFYLTFVKGNETVYWVGFENTDNGSVMKISFSKFIGTTVHAISNKSIQKIEIDKQGGSKIKAELKESNPELNSETLEVNVFDYIQ